MNVTKYLAPPHQLCRDQGPCIRSSEVCIPSPSGDPRRFYGNLPRFHVLGRRLPLHELFYFHVDGFLGSWSRGDVFGGGVDFFCVAGCHEAQLQHLGKQGRQMYLQEIRTVENFSL